MTNYQPANSMVQGLPSAVNSHSVSQENASFMESDMSSQSSQNPAPRMKYDSAQYKISLGFVLIISFLLAGPYVSVIYTFIFPSRDSTTYKMTEYGEDDKGSIPCRGTYRIVLSQSLSVG
jgi:hypothetical protein